MCDKCRKGAPIITEPVCIKCGKHIGRKQERLCDDCMVKEHIFNKNIALLPYEGQSKTAMYRLKYGRNKTVAYGMGELALSQYEQYFRSLNLDAIIPIPLHRNREKERGYNQAYLIAKVIGDAINVPVVDDYLVRCEDTVPQKQLNDEQRKNNVKNAFLIRENGVKLVRIMLIDDIYTTGATLDEASMVLRRRGVKEIHCFTICIGRGY